MKDLSKTHRIDAERIMWVDAPHLKTYPNDIYVFLSF